MRVGSPTLTQSKDVACQIHVNGGRLSLSLLSSLFSLSLSLSLFQTYVCML